MSPRPTPEAAVACICVTYRCRESVPEGFNPRGAVEHDRELEQIAESIRADGCLQPIRVRATEHGDFVLIAGERRYRAAIKAAVMELPAIIRPAGAGGDDEHADLLIEALLENELRRDLDPASRARGYQRLLDTGRTVKGVAERLRTTQANVSTCGSSSSPRSFSARSRSARFRCGRSSRSRSLRASIRSWPLRPPSRYSTRRTPTGLHMG